MCLEKEHGFGDPAAPEYSGMPGPSMFGVGGTAHNSNMGHPVDCNLKAGAPLCRPADDVGSLWLPDPGGGWREGSDARGRLLTSILWHTSPLIFLPFPPFLPLFSKENRLWHFWLRKFLVRFCCCCHYGHYCHEDLIVMREKAWKEIYQWSGFNGFLHLGLFLPKTTMSQTNVAGDHFSDLKKYGNAAWWREWFHI